MHFMQVDDTCTCRKRKADCLDEEAAYYELVDAFQFFCTSSYKSILHARAIQLLRSNPSLITKRFPFPQEDDDDDEEEEDTTTTEGVPIYHFIKAGAHLNMIRALCELNPRVIWTVGHSSGMLALHFACWESASHEMIEFLANEYPRAVDTFCPDEWGIPKLPLHMLLQSDSPPLETLRTLVNLGPQSLFRPVQEYNCVLDFALTEHDLTNAEVLNFLTDKIRTTTNTKMPENLSITIEPLKFLDHDMSQAICNMLPMVNKLVFRPEGKVDPKGLVTLLEKLSSGKLPNLTNVDLQLDFELIEQDFKDEVMDHLDVLLRKKTTPNLSIQGIPTNCRKGLELLYVLASEYMLCVC